MDIIVSFESLSDVGLSVVLLQTHTRWHHHSLMPHAAWLNTAHHCTSNRQQAKSLLHWWCSKRPWTSSSI